MSTKFYLRHRQSGKRWEPQADAWGHTPTEFLALYDSGQPFIVRKVPYETYIKGVDLSVWELVVKDNILKKGKTDA